MIRYCKIVTGCKRKRCMHEKDKAERKRVAQGWEKEWRNSFSTRRSKTSCEKGEYIPSSRRIQPYVWLEKLFLNNLRASMLYRCSFLYKKEISVR